jgi:hypothetical protein
MLSTVNPQRNACHRHKLGPLHLHWNGYGEEEALTRMWRNVGSPTSPLVGTVNMLQPF